ncbi:MAG: glycosyltransferase [Paracoccaceae bacterium]
MRRSDIDLVDAKDREEEKSTRYLLHDRVALLVETIAEVAGNPRGAARALASLARLRTAERFGLVRACAYFAEAVRLKRCLRRDGARHLHAHFASNAATVALLARRLGGPPFSFTAHGPEDFEPPIAHGLARKVGRAAFVVAISHFAKARLVAAAGLANWDRVEVVGCGVDLARLDTLPRPVGVDPMLVCVGRLVGRKGQTLLPLAFGRVAARHPHARLVLLGDGPTRAEIEAAIAERGLSRNVSLPGWADNAAVHEAIARSCALVAPSLSEGLPLVLMEALALGRPVIATPVGGVPELVDADCGWLVPAGDVDALAEAMGAALDMPQARLGRLGAVGRRRGEARHGVERNAERLAALFARYGEPAKPAGGKRLTPR